MGRCDGFRILTDYADALSNHASTPLWNPRVVPRVVPSAMVREVRVAIWLSGLTDPGPKARAAVDFSSDGLQFLGSPKELYSAYNATSAGWSYESTWVDIWALTGVTRRLNMRFGLQCLNNSGTGKESAQARMLIEGKPFWWESVALGPRRVHTLGSTTRVFCPMSEPIPSERIREVRATQDRYGATGTMNSQPGWQETDTPDDPSTWGSVNTFGSDESSDGIAFPTDFTSVTPTKRYLRFGLNCANASAGDLLAVVAGLRVDLRD